MKSLKIIAAAVAVVGSACAHAGVTEAEAKQLGTTLTEFGAEKAANKEGTIPAYTGGLPASTAPAGFKKGSGKWADPFANEKPLYTVTAANMAQYADKLSETNKALLKRYPSYRLDVYPTHRSIAYPKWFLENSVKNATRAQSTKGGLAIEGAQGGVPFPIPKSGYEVMWNHMLRYQAYAREYITRNWYVNSSGKAIMSSEFRTSLRMPYYEPNSSPDGVKKAGNVGSQSAYDYTAPARIAGDGTTYTDFLDPVEEPRRAWSYSASTRRARVAPDIAYDTPVASQGGAGTYDDTELFQGKMDRYDFKLIGKREMLLPYNTYKLAFYTSGVEATTPNHLNPAAVRWELHRVWVVEAQLKPAFRHIYNKRVFYLDEDWGAGMSDAYDASGKLTNGLFRSVEPLYDVAETHNRLYWGYNLSTGVYMLASHTADVENGIVTVKDMPKRVFLPDSLAGRGNR